MKINLKTETFGYPNPSLVVCKGHVDAKTFNKAFERENKVESDHQKNSSHDGLAIRYVYGKITLNGCFKIVEPTSPNAKKYTVADWD